MKNAVLVVVTLMGIILSVVISEGTDRKQLQQRQWEFQKNDREIDKYREFQKILNSAEDTRKMKEFSGYHMISKGNYEEAIKIFEDIIQEYNSIKSQDRIVLGSRRYISSDTYNGLGIAHFRLKKYKEAIESFKKAIEIKPDNPSSLAGIAMVYRNSGEYEEAIKTYKQMIDLKVYEITAYGNLSYCLIETDRYVEAIKAAKQAISIKPDEEIAHNNLGVAYRELEKYEEAIEAFEESKKINPDYPRSHYNLGITYLRMNDSEGATREYEMLQNIAPELAHKLLSMINENTGVIAGSLKKDDDVKSEIINLSKGKIVKIKSMPKKVWKNASIEITQSKELNNLEVKLIGQIKAVDGFLCFGCVKDIKIAPNLKVPIDPIFINRKINDSDLQVKQVFTSRGELYNVFIVPIEKKLGKEKGHAYLLSGSEGATLEKELDGFILLDGHASIHQ